MNRKPSTYISAPARDIANPAPLRAKLRLVRGGPYVAAEIRHELGRWTAWVDGRMIADAGNRPGDCPEIMRIWTFGRDVTPQEWRALTRSGRDVDATAPIDLSRKESLF